MNRVKKSQFTFHCDPKLLETMKQRSIVNNRTVAGEIEYILKQVLKKEEENNRNAISMAAQGKKKLDERTASE